MNRIIFFLTAFSLCFSSCKVSAKQNTSEATTNSQNKEYVAKVENFQPESPKQTKVDENDWTGIYYFDTESDGEENYPYFYYIITLDSNQGNGLSGKVYSTECVEGFVYIHDIKTTVSVGKVIVKTLGGIGVDHQIHEASSDGETFTIMKDGAEFKVAYNGNTYKLTKRQKQNIPANIKNLNLDMYGVIGGTIGTLQLNGTSGKYSYLNNIKRENGEYIYANRVIKEAKLNGNHLTITGYEKSGKRIGNFDGIYNGYVYSGTFTNYKGVKIKFYLWNQNE